MTGSWPTAGSAASGSQAPTPHACVGGLAISTCPTCAGHPQGYRNPICQQCKGCGVVTEACQQCRLHRTDAASTNTSQLTSPATSCDRTHDGACFSDFYGRHVERKTDGPGEDGARRDTDANGKDPS